MNAISPSEPVLPAMSPAVRNFADALAALDSWADLSATRRRDLATALTTISRALRLPAGAVPCDVAWLNERLFSVEPAVLGFSAARFRTVTSDLRAVLRRLAIHAPDMRGEGGLSDSWRELLAAVPIEAQRAALRGFGRHCTTAGVEPADVSDTILAAFAEADRASRLSASAADRAGIVARAWNASRRAGLPGWPDRRLAAPPRRERYTLPFSSYPESFQADVASFAERLTQESGGSIFLDAGQPTRRLRPATIKARVFAIRQAAAALVIAGLAPTALTSLRNLVQPLDRAGRILDHYFRRAGGKTGGQLGQIAETLRQIARYHIGLTGADLVRIEGWARGAVPRGQKGLRPKVRDRLRKLIAPRAKALLLHLPAELMRRAAACDPGSTEGACFALTAVALEILLVCPMRMKNLTELRLDKHLQRIGGRGRGRYTHIVLQESETKNSEPLEWPLPPESARLIDTYISRHRLAIADPASPYLFPAASGVGMRAQNTLANAISTAVERNVGVEVHPHLLRHFAAWLYLNTHPGEYEMVRRVLGHRSVETTIASYCGLEAPAAAQRFDSLVLRERGATRAVARAAWKTARRSQRSGR
jgi:integrase